MLFTNIFKFKFYWEGLKKYPRFLQFFSQAYMFSLLSIYYLCLSDFVHLSVSVFVCPSFLLIDLMSRFKTQNPFVIKLLLSVSVCLSVSDFVCLSVSVCQSFFLIDLMSRFKFQNPFVRKL